MSYRDGWNGDAEEAQARASMEAEADHYAGLEAAHNEAMAAEQAAAEAIENDIYNQGYQRGLSEMQSKLTQAEAENMAVRKYLWLGHGAVAPYGDDGEMQCCCNMHVCDFKRNPIERCIEHHKKGLAKLLNKEAPDAQH